MITTPISFRRVLGTSSTASSFASAAPTVTAPSTSTEGVFDLTVEDTLVVVPFGAGSADQAIGVRVVGWREARKDSARTLWVPFILADLAATLGTAAGVAGAACVATDLFADAITVTTPASAVDSVTPTVTANTVASTRISVAGYQKIQFLFYKNSATNANALFAMYSTEY